jgi:hypothetical protein
MPDKPIRMTTLAARSLTEEIAALREDIHKQGAALADIDVSLCQLVQQLRQWNIALRPLRHPAAEE